MALRRRYAALLTPLLLTALVAIPIGWIWRQAQQAWLDQQLVRALQDENTGRAILFLEQGANPNCLVPDEPIVPIPIWEVVHQRLSGKKPLALSGTPSLLWVLNVAADSERDCLYNSENCELPQENLPLVAALLAHGANVNVSDARGITPLILALQWRYDALAELLVRYHAEVNQNSILGTPLMVAVANKGDNEPLRLSTLERLLKRGANVNARDEIGDTVFINAFCYGGPVRLPIVDFLLKHGAKIDALDREGKTALMCAVWNRDRPAVQFLLSHHADVRLRSNLGSVLYYAEALTNPQIWALTNRIVLGNGSPLAKRRTK